MDVRSVLGELFVGLVKGIVGNVSSKIGGLGEARSLKRMDVGNAILLNSQKLSQEKGCEESARRMKEVGDFQIEQAHHDLIPPTYSKWFIRVEIVIAGLFLGLLLSYWGYSANIIDFVLSIIVFAILLVAFSLELKRLDKVRKLNRQSDTRESASSERVRGIPASESVTLAIVSFVFSLLVFSFIFNIVVSLGSWIVRLVFVVVAIPLCVVFLYNQHRNEMPSSEFPD